MARGGENQLMLLRRFIFFLFLHFSDLLDVFMHPINMFERRGNWSVSRGEIPAEGRQVCWIRSGPRYPSGVLGPDFLRATHHLGHLLPNP